MSEFEIVQDCYYKILRCDQYKEVLLEIPFLSRSIDMVIIDNSNNIITIEFKLKDWRKAMKQAQDHSLGAEKSYVCLPKKLITESIISNFSQSPLGLYAYNIEEDFPLEEIVSPTPIKGKWDMWSKSLQKSINNIVNEPIFI